MTNIPAIEIRPGDFIKAWLPKAPAAKHQASRRGWVLDLHGIHITFRAPSGKTYLTTRALVRDAWRKT